MSKQSRLNKAKAQKEKAQASEDSRQDQSQRPQQPHGDQRQLWEPGQGSSNRQEKSR